MVDRAAHDVDKQGLAGLLVLHAAEVALAVPVIEPRAGASSGDGFW